MTTNAEILRRKDGVAGVLSLNRPQALHALTLAMCEAMIAALLEWRDDPSVRAVILDHAEGRGFCAGGDVNLVRRSALEDGGKAGRAFFYREYQLNHLLFTYPKPVIAFMDGITMGGGVGISQPASIRVASENTRLAMPETAIGLFPDVGGGWYLSRLGGRVGPFLALTGARLDGVEGHWLGLATHYLPSASFAKAKAGIAAGEEPEQFLASLCDPSPPKPRIAANAARITHHFASDRLEDILASLAGDADPWAAKELATLRSKSPTSCKIALRQLATSLTLGDFAENMTMEYALTSRVMMLPDFAEGVRAVLVDKDQAPRWDPATPELVSDGMLDALFAPLSRDDAWRPL